MVKKDVKSKLAAKKWLLWKVNGKKFNNDLSQGRTLFFTAWLFWIRYNLHPSA